MIHQNLIKHHEAFLNRVLVIILKIGDKLSLWLGNNLTLKPSYSFNISVFNTLDEFLMDKIFSKLYP